MTDFLPLFAIHISDGVLSPAASTIGFLLSGVLIAFGLRGVTDEEIPRIGVLTGAFFVASQIHLPVGVTTVHLLLNGLLGVILGRRAVPAIAVGLTLQCLLFAHGGHMALGANIGIYAIPALAAGSVFRWTVRARLMESRGVRIGTAFVVAFFWLFTAERTANLLFHKLVATDAEPSVGGSIRGMGDWQLQLAVALVVGIGAGVVAACWRISGAFALGLLLGTATGLGTVALQACVLVYGGTQDWHALAWAVLLANLPVVAIEALGLGVVIGYLERVKPEWIGKVPDQSSSGKISSNGISH